MCDKVVPEDLFILKYCLDRYKTQEMSDKTVDTFLLTLKFVPNWFVISKMIKKLDDDCRYNLLLMKFLIMSHFLVMKWVFLV